MRQHGECGPAFASAVAGRNYELAYGFMSDLYKRDIGHGDFLQSLSRYRDGYETPPTFQRSSRTIP